MRGVVMPVLLCTTSAPCTVSEPVHWLRCVPSVTHRLPGRDDAVPVERGVVERRRRAAARASGGVGGLAARSAAARARDGG